VILESNGEQCDSFSRTCVDNGRTSERSVAICSDMMDENHQSRRTKIARGGKRLIHNGIDREDRSSRFPFWMTVLSVRQTEEEVNASASASLRFV